MTIKQSAVNQVLSKDNAFVNYSDLQKLNNFTSAKIIIEDVLTKQHIQNIKNTCTDLIIQVNTEYSDVPPNFCELTKLETLKLGTKFVCNQRINIDLDKMINLREITWANKVTIFGVRQFFKFNSHLINIVRFSWIENNCNDLNKKDIETIAPFCEKFTLTPTDKNHDNVFLNSDIFLYLTSMKKLTSLNLGHFWIFPMTDDMFTIENLEELTFGNNWCYELDPRIVNFKKLKKIVFSNKYEKEIPFKIISKLPNIQEIQLSESYWLSNSKILIDLQKNIGNLKFKNYDGYEFTK